MSLLSLELAIISAALTASLTIVLGLWLRKALKPATLHRLTGGLGILSLWVQRCAALPRG